MGTNVKNYSINQILTKVESLPSFKSIPSDYWLFGVRSSHIIPNMFCDEMYQMKGQALIKVTSCTTDPGSPGLIDYKKYNNDGIAVVKDGEWYYNLWKYGMHKDKMPALKQINDILYYRDNNGNKTPEEIGVVHKGVIGIDWHTGTYLPELQAVKLVIPDVGTWSLGCQVMDVVKDYYAMLDLMKNQASVSYCLVKEW